MIRFALPLLAFGFSSASVLGWLAAIAAPVAIHFWTRHHHHDVPWAATEFLQAALRKSSRRIQLGQWLLLAVRMGLIATLVVALAEPYLQSSGAPLAAGAGQQRTHRVLVIDGSYSMAARQTAGRATPVTRLAAAQELAAQIVDESREGDGFTLLLLADPPRVIVPTPVFEPEALVREIQSLAPPHGGADLSAALAKIKEIIAQAKSQQPGLERTEIYFLTDLQRVTWRISDADKRSIEELGRSAALYVFDLGDDDAENLAVTGFSVAAPPVLVGQDVTLLATLHNFGRQPRTGERVELLVDGRAVHEQRVDVPAGQQRTISLVHRFDEGGDLRLEIRTEPDVLDLDNHRWLATPVQQRLRVLCIAGKPGETFFLARALSPGPAARGGVDVVEQGEAALSDLDLAKFDCIMLSNVGQFTGGEARRLEAYLRAGGGLVFFLGDRVLADRYNQELMDNSGIPLLPARLSEAAPSGQYTIDPLDYKHPIAAAFRDHEAAGLLTTPVSKYWRLEPSTGEPLGEPALAFSSGDPAIVARPVARGRVVVVTTAGSLASVDAASGRPWTAAPTWPSFLPLVREVLAWSVGRRWEDANVTVGEPIGGPLPASLAQTVISVRTPDGQRRELQPQATATGAAWSLPRTEFSGMYVVETPPENSRRSVFAANLDTRESDLAVVDADGLPSDLVVVSDWRDRGPTGAVLAAAPAGLESPLLHLALLLIVVESVVAGRFLGGRR